ncbi:hypothetical protein LSAT2_029902 [Lamellibrachia satsuma]|nr:hypothetical protein LSAT2_029902 [Lamellibrachia satsuma]
MSPGEYSDTPAVFPVDKKKLRCRATIYQFALMLRLRKNDVTTATLRLSKRGFTPQRHSLGCWFTVLRCRKTVFVCRNSWITEILYR